MNKVLKIYTKRNNWSLLCALVPGGILFHDANFLRSVIHGVKLMTTNKTVINMNFLNSPRSTRQQHKGRYHVNCKWI